MMNLKKAPLFIILAFFVACQNAPQTVEETTSPTISKIAAPSFNADHAYELIKTQVDFGPRVPGTPAQKKCAEWIQTELKKYADSVYIQNATVLQPVTNKHYPATNIIASFNTQADNRVLLLAHWDSRPWADEDTHNKDLPIDAADDGGSGIAVLLEIAAQMKLVKPGIGVDLLFVDAEDVGRSEWTEDSYCLGTQYWAHHPHVANYKAMFGICLDMVGAKGAQFPLEGFSQSYAGTAQKEIWDAGNRLGYSAYFVYNNGGTITDDHVVINQLAHIPCVDIINLQPGGNFAPHWHTHQDQLAIIDKATLKAVGQTVLEVIYNQ